MNITLATGFPGSGKTLYMLWLLKKKYQDKNVYVHGVDGLDWEYFNAKECDITRWFELPPNSVLLVDEAHKYFPPRSSHKTAPTMVEEFAELRHYGIEVILITQTPWSIDSFIRQRVYRHFHIKRRLGLPRATIFEFEGVHDKPQDVKARKDALRVFNWRYKKEIYNHYKSAEIHNTKVTVPPKMIGAAIFAVVALLVIFNFASWLFSDDKFDDTETAKESDSSGFGAFPTPDDFAKSSPGDLSPSIGTPEYELVQDSINSEYFLARHEPVEGLPWTSPYYQDVMEPVTYPKPMCIKIENDKECLCHSQQGTRLNVGVQSCIYFVENGFFDPTKPDPEPQPFGSSPPGSLGRSFVPDPEPSRTSNQTTQKGPIFTNWTKKR